MEKEYILVRMGQVTMANGKMAKWRAKEFEFGQMMNAMKDYGKMINEMDMEFKLVQMEPNMKVNGKTER